MKGFYSFVHPEKLADLFELISKQLRLSKNIELGDNCSKYESITLPCIEHPSNKDISNDNIDTSPPMFMHVTLIGDSDPNRRCFHCLLTGVSNMKFLSDDMFRSFLINCSFAFFSRCTWNGG